MQAPGRRVEFFGAHRATNWWFNELDAIDKKFQGWIRTGLKVFVIILCIGVLMIALRLYALEFLFSSFLVIVLFGALVATLWFAKERIDHMERYMKYRARLEGHVYVPEWADVSWPTSDKWFLPPSDSRETHPCQDPIAKIAFLFLLYSDMPFKELWEEFFKAAVDPATGQVQFLAVVHNGNNGEGLGDLGFAHEIVPTVETDYGSAVPAHQALIRKALEDPCVRGAVFVSAACVPIKPFAEIRTQLMGGAMGQMKSILTFETERFDKCTHWQYQTREFMERYIQDPVDVKLKDGSRDAYLQDENFPPTGFRLALHHSQEEFYAPAIATRYRLPCRHGYVTLDLWIPSLIAPIASGVSYDNSKAGAPLLFTGLNTQFVRKVRDCEICFLRKVKFNTQNLEVLSQNLRDKPGAGETPRKSIEGYTRLVDHPTATDAGQSFEMSTQVSERV
jgi:hypothetical protein